MITTRNREALVAVVLGVAALVAGIQLINPVKGAVTPAGTITTNAVVSAAWNRTWGGATHDYGMGIWSDGSSIYTCGYTDSAGAGAYDMLLVKWDASGNQLWNRTWGDAGGNTGDSIWGSSTAIYTCGDTYIVNKTEMLLVKWDAASGNQLWNRTFGGSQTSSGNSVWTDGTSVYTCGAIMNVTFSHDLLLVKWDASGNQLWNRTWGGSNDEYGNSVRGAGTEVYTGGHTNSFGNGGYDMLLVKWNATSGNQLWNRTWGDAGEDVIYDLWTDGTSIYACGGTDINYYYGGNTDMALLKYRANGGLSFSKTFGGSATEYGNAVVATSSAIYTLGFTTSSGNDDFLLVQWDLEGNQTGNLTWGGADDDDGNALWSNGVSICACGYTYSFGAGDADMAIIKWTLPSTVLGIDLVPYIALAAVFAIAFLAIKLKRARGIS
nr:hypothetical protein [Candidatus Sigynarchaeota archaeon]